MPSTPRSITIYGAGVIGCEYASIFRGLGCKVDLVNTRSQLLAFLDDEIIHALNYHLRDQGVMIRHNEVYECVEYHADSVTLQLNRGRKSRAMPSSGQWRTGNANDMGLEALGITPNSRGHLRVNANYQTELPTSMPWATSSAIPV